MPLPAFMEPTASSLQPTIKEFPGLKGEGGSKITHFDKPCLMPVQPPPRMLRLASQVEVHDTPRTRRHATGGAAYGQRAEGSATARVRVRSTLDTTEVRMYA